MRLASERLKDRIHELELAKEELEEELEEKSGSIKVKNNLEDTKAALMECEARLVFMQLTIQVHDAKTDKNTEGTYVEYLIGQLKVADRKLNAIQNGEVFDADNLETQWDLPPKDHLE